MANDDFNFGDFSFDDTPSTQPSSDSMDDLFDFGNDTESDDDNEYGDLSNSALEDRKATRKTSLVAIIFGIILIAVVFLIVNLITGRDDKDNIKDSQIKNEPSSSVVESSQENPNKAPDNINNPVNTPENPPIESQKPPVNQEGTKPTSNNSDGWIEIPDNADISWSENYINSNFSVTSKKHYIKIIDNSNFEIKTVLSGVLAGFTGTYELEVPYTKGTSEKLVIGTNFDVKVQVGTDTTGKTVIGEIKY